MTDFEVIDWWRLCNAALALVAAILLTLQLWRIRYKAPPRIMLLGFAQCHMLGILVIAGLANVFFDQPLIGVSMASTAVIWILWALLFTPQAFETSEPRGGP